MRLYKKKTVITREDGRPYLVRYSIFSCSWFAVKVHNLLISDDNCLHDHPWAFFTIILKEGYVEHTPTGSRVYGRFSILYRHLNYIHRLEIHKPAWTLVVTFKKRKPWGFFTKKGWIPWQKYQPNGSCD